jgi:hypothetical protein
MLVMVISIEKAILEIKNKWMDIEGVNGVWSTKEKNKDYIEVHVHIRTLEIDKKIPSKFKGFPVKIIEGGNITIQ